MSELTDAEIDAAKSAFISSLYAVWPNGHITLWDLIDKYPGGSIAMMILVCLTLIICVRRD